MGDGRTLEMHYQCDIKGYDPGGRNWRLGKGKPPIDTSVDLYGAYKALWRLWCNDHTDLLYELIDLAAKHDWLLSDRFATSPISQARALSEIINETLRTPNE